MIDRDDIRPKGFVEVECSGLGCVVPDKKPDETGWMFWIDPLDPRLPGGPFICPSCLAAMAVKS